jgi:hypothetical protein
MMNSNMRPLIEGAVCPLAKYEIKPEKNLPDWWKAPREYFEPTEHELFALCASCENCTVVERGDYLEAETKDWKVCLDCPVHSYTECITENAAEAACS